MIKESLISVIVPVYNTKFTYIEKAISSILAQDYTNYEIIIADDGSKKEYANELDNRFNLNKKIKIYHIEHGGVSKARNYAISQAGGEVITFVDADDYVSSHWLSSLYSLMHINDLDVITGYFDYTYNDDMKFIDDGITTSCEILDEDKSKIQKLILGNLALPKFQKGYISNYAGALYKRDIVKKYLFPENVPFMEDTIWSYEVFSEAGRIGIADCQVYAYRQNMDSATHRAILFDVDVRIDTLNKMKNLLKIDNDIYPYWGLRVLSNYSMICRICARCTEIKGIKNRVDTAMQYWNHEIFDVLRKSDISVEWPIKQKIKLWLAKLRILPILYVLDKYVR